MGVHRFGGGAESPAQVPLGGRDGWPRSSGVSWKRLARTGGFVRLDKPRQLGRVKRVLRLFDRWRSSFSVEQSRRVALSGACLIRPNRRCLGSTTRRALTGACGRRAWSDGGSAVALSGAMAGSVRGVESRGWRRRTTGDIRAHQRSRSSPSRKAQGVGGTTQVRGHRPRVAPHAGSEAFVAKNHVDWMHVARREPDARIK